MAKILVRFFVFAGLTIFTQVGGVCYVIAIWLSKKVSFYASKLIFFVIVYALVSVVLVPLIAPLFGRVPLPVHGTLSPNNILTCAMNRHYVVPALKDQLETISKKMSLLNPTTKTLYLDANFPFIDGFPLIPHLSHSDGKKIDLAFYYFDQESQEPVQRSPSALGYGVYDAPRESEYDMPGYCADQGYWQYGILGSLIFGEDDNLDVDMKRTVDIIMEISADSRTSKIFIEPHLKTRWGLGHLDNIRFHGCRAVRHDDHIHYQIK